MAVGFGIGFMLVALLAIVSWLINTGRSIVISNFLMERLPWLIIAFFVLFLALLCWQITVKKVFSGLARLFTGPVKKCITPLREHRGATAVFITACVMFLIIRFFICLTAVDHLHGIDEAEYQIAQHARYLMGESPSIRTWNHLWGQRATAYALIPFLRLGLSETAAMKFLTILISFIGFSSLVYLFAWKMGPVHAGILSVLLIFPNINYLKWSLTLWGAYPEAAALIATGILIWVVGISKNKIPLFFLTGLISGLVLSYNPSVLYVPLALLLFGPLVQNSDGRLRNIVGLILGMVAGLLPIFIYLISNGLDLDWSKHTFDTSINHTIFESISLPSISRITLLFTNLGKYDIWINPLETVVVLLGCIWMVFTMFSDRFQEFRWRLIFPVSLLLGVLAISAFPLVNFIGLRHVLWLFPSMYVFIAVFLGDRIIMDDERNLPWIRIETGLKFIVFLFLAIPHILAVIPLIQPPEKGMLQRYRGMTYYINSMGSMIGDEVGAVNRFFDTLPDGMTRPEYWDFREGIGKVFPITGYYRCCRMDPIMIDLANISIPKKCESKKKFYMGVGCGVALKSNMTKEDLISLPKLDDLDVLSAANEGHEGCISFADSK